MWIPAGEAADRADIAYGTAMFLRREDSCVVFATGSGTYRLTDGDLSRPVLVGRWPGRDVSECL
ncbi:hypothetical protein [Streptomyces phaeochromogenes]